MNDVSEMLKSPGLWEGQLLHFTSLFALVLVVAFAWNELGNPHLAAFWIAVAFPVLHQVWAWLAWRIELKASAISNSIGFTGYLVIFYILFGGRFLSLIWLALLD